MVQSNDMTETEYLAFKAFLEQRCGILLGEGKHYLVTSRLAKLMRDQGITSLGALLTAIQQVRHTDLHDKVIDAMTTNETSWFRDGSPFTALEKEIIPRLEEKTTSGCRIWSAACSTGQEPYTISMILSEYLTTHAQSRLQRSDIIATDISSRVLDEAKLGIYDDGVLGRGLPTTLKQRYFSAVEQGWAVEDNIKRRIRFKQQNLLDSYASLGHFDVIFCRNVLIYFSAELKADIMNRMAELLNPGGYLVLGASETTLNYSDKFRMIRSPAGVYFQRES